ncbi:MAG: hypothetical protein J6C77_01965 [Muribaculaceae bacterium]|nr:hypothetical protein [Muribaculaceae bacterium]
MAKDKNTETRTAIDDLNDSLSRAELRVQNNKKNIMWASVAVAAIVAILLIYIYGFHRPAVNKANNDFGLANNAYLSASATGEPTDTALVEIAELFEAAAANGHQGGNNATLMAAIVSYQAGDWQKALDLLDDYDRTDEVIATTSQVLAGDCYVNLGDLEKGLETFKDAQETADGNPLLVPYILIKQANVNRELKNYSEEAAIYQTLLDEYPLYQQQCGVDFRLALDRAKAQAGTGK